MRASIGVAGLIAVGLVGWMASGQPALRALFGAAPVEAPAVATRTPDEARTRVRVITSAAEPITRELELYGRTEPHREVMLRAETSGRIVEILAEKGEPVEAGRAILRIDARERGVMVDQARALLRQREVEYDAARQLGTRGFQAENRVAEALAQLEAARAELRAREVALAQTTLVAPFGGILDDRMVEIGDFVDTGDTIGHLLEQDPLLVSAEVNETRKRDVRVGMTVEVELADGRRAFGELRYLSRRAEPETRTFRIEVVVPNPDLAISAGMSATLRLRFGETPAHRLSAALLALDERHRLGVKLVDDADVVRFVPVDLVRAESDAVWVAGLPETARIIIVGQGFVRDGEAVLPVMVPARSVADPGGGIGR